jgi:hypothetical protein
VKPTRTLSRRIASGIALTLAATALAGCSLLESIVTGVPEGETDVFALAIGDCLNESSVTDEVTSVPTVDCSEPHDFEVFALTDTTTSEFPDIDSLFTELDIFCQGEVFTEFVGIPYADSIYGTTGLVPTAESWANGDRELLCMISDPNGQTTGSLAGINQ